MREHFLEKNGIYYRTNNFVEGRPTLLFVHGIGGSSSAWYRHEATYDNKYNLISFDLRGHGKSKKYEDYKDYAREKFVEDIDDLVTHLASSVAAWTAWVCNCWKVHSLSSARGRQ